MEAKKLQNEIEQALVSATEAMLRQHTITVGALLFVSPSDVRDHARVCAANLATGLASRTIDDTLCLTEEEMALAFEAEARAIRMRIEERNIKRARELRETLKPFQDKVKEKL